MLDVSWIIAMIPQSQGPNAFFLHYTGKQFDVSLYCDNYEADKGIPIVFEETSCQSPEAGQNYILFLHETLWMGDTLDHILVNPNQQRHYGS